MLLLIMISCVIFQTAVTIYLFNINKTGDSFEKNLTRILIVLLGHLCTKFFLLFVFKDVVLYGQVASGFGLAYGPLLFIIANAFFKKPLPRSVALAHLIPFFTSSIIYMVLITGSQSGEISSSFIIKYTSYFQWFVVVSLLVYSFTVKSILHRHKKESAFNDPAVTVKWKLVNNMAGILAAGILAGMFFEFTGVIKTPIRDFDLRVLPYGCFAVIPVLILKYKLEPIFNKAVIEPMAEKPLPEIAILPLPTAAEDLALADTAVKRYEKSSLDEDTMDTYEKSLKKYVEKHKVYLNAELSLEELALQVKIPKHHLTQLLNDRLGKNFYAYVNEYRVQEAINRLKNMKDDVNILSLAYDCGFNSKSSFNNYFKKVTGYTPSAYRKMIETSPAINSKLTA